MSAYTSGTSPVVPWADSPAPHPATVRLYVLRLSRSRSNNKSIEAFKRNALLPTLLLFSFGAFCIRNAAYVFFFVCYYYTSLSRSLYIYIYILFLVFFLFVFSESWRPRRGLEGCRAALLGAIHCRRRPQGFGGRWATGGVWAFAGAPSLSLSLTLSL